jgi:UDP-N-acetylglucosamine diphosphorylase/glucosamine-1-phosphate N-acetyltransferase
METNIILFDDNRWEQFLPLTYTRPVSMLRVGILTIREKWELALGVNCHFHTVDYLRRKYLPPLNYGKCLAINAGVLPNAHLVAAIKAIEEGEAIVSDGKLLAAILPDSASSGFSFNPNSFKNIRIIDNIDEINYPWDIFALNGKALEVDFDMITRGRKSMPIPISNRVINPERVFIEPGAKVECAVLNASEGSIYIGADAEIMEGSLVRGPFALCEHSTLKLGAKIYGPTTIGPHCKVGGEVNNSVIFGYSNKAHDGFLGNSVIGEWCNLGADTNTSNLKNNYAHVKVWNYKKGGFIDTGLQFCGLIMGDHSKCGINTMFNTGTVVGVSANIFGDGFPRNFIPSFSWGGAQGFATYKTVKAFETAKIVMARRGLELNSVDKEIMQYIFDQTAIYRH